ncbi:MAG: aminoacyl-tRNA hydrolase [Anaerovibrio sp.]|nr:aminoacyl-tRNA hydrolase [Anaerovibrio sp.]
MKMIVGLGNPGREYAETKHNVGWMLVDALAKRLGAEAWRAREKGMVAEARIGAEKVLLVKPLTYMNNSGECAGPLMRWYKLEPEDVIVAHDDMDIPAGSIRIRKKGSDGGHNGIKSLIAHLGSQSFGRVRIGVGRPLSGWSVIDHVLSPFSAEDMPKVQAAVDYLLPAVECMVLEGADNAMNKYNPRKQKKQRAERPGTEENAEAGGMQNVQGR